jgi:hypothetical protein
VGSRREDLITAIVELLGDGRARTARDIAASLRERRGLEYARRRDVNSVLYAELAGRTARDDAYRWTLAPGPQAAATGAADGPAQVDIDRGLLLRAVHRLRCGLPPSERVRDITVGDGELVATIESWLNGAGGPRWLRVSGNYGEGKSHTLSLLREIAHDRGYATCTLTADGSSSALNHPQRFLPVMLGTLEVPGTAFCGYEHLLYGTFIDAARASAARAVVRAHLTAGRTVDVETLLAIAGIISVASRPEGVGTDEHGRLIRTVTLHLSGESARHRPGTSASRALTYALLGVAMELVALAGASGLVLLVDEVESIYTKLPNARSRRGAYRVLSALCEAAELAGLRVALAITPDAERQMHADLSDLPADDGALTCEPIDMLAQSALSGVVQIECRPLSEDEREDLVYRVRRLLEAAYGPVPGVSPSAWTDFVEEVAGLEIPVRLLVRHVVDFIDAHRYGHAL